ncbi:MAG TPA: CBASS oligonucleotide cyclase [Verrucomicrobiae bacterium]|nr:CBASS oligonucleotide cyclase [Verrucomicrobiae bacterium]
MITTTEAFRKFRSNLEITQKEQDDASRRQKEIRSLMDSEFVLEDDFLSGSYKRFTKTKPLKDVDIFCVFHDDERDKYRNKKHPSLILGAVEKMLAKNYSADKVSKQRRSICIEFPFSAEEDRVMSFDVVPAFTKGDHYEIPDLSTVNGWTETNPKVHAEKATAANEKFDGEWKGMVRMIKAWNNEKEKPVKPAFLLEVMCHDLLRPPFNGNFPYEFMQLFASAAGRIEEEWAEPAGLGPPVSDSMSASQKAAAKKALLEAGYSIREGLNFERNGSQGEALRTYRNLFGAKFPLS